MDEKLKETVSFLVFESSQTRLDRIIHKLVVALVVAIALLFISNALWLWAWSQYDTVNEEYSYTQDGRGINIIGNDNEVLDGADTTN